MLKARIYIVQFLGVILLLCGYLIGNQPDNLSVMHFDSNPIHPYVIKKATKSTAKHSTVQTISSHTGKHPRKSNAPKFLQLDLQLPTVSDHQYYETADVTYSGALPEHYYYQFYKEINPPPSLVS